MNDTANTPPDRLSNNPDSPYYDEAVLARDVGIRFKGAEKTNVEEYCVSEGWIRVAAGSAKDRNGNPLTIRLNGPVEPYFRSQHPTLRRPRSREMPLVRIDLIEGKPADYRKTIGDVVYEAIVDIMKAPQGDRFQIITEHPEDGLIADPKFFDIARTKDCVFIQVTLNHGRTLEQKRAFYKAIAEGLHARLKLRREDVFINLVEVAKENWSFGNGIAQYAP